MKKIKTIDCLGMGIVPFDLLFSVNKYPKAEMKIDADDFKMQGGGPIPNVTVGLSRLGYNTALIAVVGNDIIGDLGISELESEKVICDYVIKKKQSSAVASGWIEKDSGRRTMVLSRKIFIRPNDLMLSDYPIPKIVHLDGRDMPATIKLARWAKKAGAIVSFDIGSIRNDVSSVFPLVDHLVVADSYALPFTKSRTAKQAILKLNKICKGTIIV
ncbi:MAG: PfkB family carbohydrate kinase, partial [candidate division Zixibacteria bacterium]|nr:PfkB family carbohydrate kinase [candidate division Zixibacteria bacterium]